MCVLSNCSMIILWSVRLSVLIARSVVGTGFFSAGLSLVNRKRTEPKKKFGFAMLKETNGNKSSFPKN